VCSPHEAKRFYSARKGRFATTTLRVLLVCERGIRIGACLLLDVDPGRLVKDIENMELLAVAERSVTKPANGVDALENELRDSRRHGWQSCQ
jgi:hypothetical protein